MKTEFKEISENEDKQLIYSLLCWVIMSLVSLNGLGVLLDVTWLMYLDGGHSYFLFDIPSLKGVPFWLLSSFLLIAFNGIAILRIYYNRLTGLGKRSMPYFPLLGANLVIIPSLMVMFMFLFGAA